MAGIDIDRKSRSGEGNVLLQMLSDPITVSLGGSYRRISQASNFSLEANILSGTGNVV